MSHGLAAGLLDQRVTLQSRVLNKDALGTNDYSFADLATSPTVWARVQPLRGREFFAAGEMQSEVTTKITIRYRADVDSTMRVLWEGAPYDIASPPIDVDGAHAFLELMCMNGVADGR